MRLTRLYSAMRALQKIDGCGGMNRTYDLRIMSPTSYHCSTPRNIIFWRARWLYGKLIRVNTFFDFYDQIICTFSVFGFWYVVFFDITLEFTPTDSSCFYSVQSIMEIPVFFISLYECEIILTLLMMKSANLFIHIPEGELAPHEARSRTHFTTHKCPIRFIDKCMPSGDINPRHLYNIILCAVCLRTEYKHLSTLIDIVECECILECRSICKYEYPVLVDIQMIIVCKSLSSDARIIWIYESATLWNWRRNNLDNMSMGCRSYMFIEMMWYPAIIKREIVDTEYEGILGKISNTWYIGMKQGKSDTWQSLLSKITFISYPYCSKNVSIFVDKRCDFRNLVSPYNKKCIISYLSSPCGNQLTGEANISIIVDDRKDNVDGSKMVGWLDGWMVHTSRIFKMKIRKWETEGNKLSKNFTIKK